MEGVDVDTGGTGLREVVEVVAASDDAVGAVEFSERGVGGWDGSEDLSVTGW